MARPVQSVDHDDADDGRPSPLPYDLAITEDVAGVPGVLRAIGGLARLVEAREILVNTQQLGFACANVQHLGNNSTLP